MPHTAECRRFIWLRDEGAPSDLLRRCRWLRDFDTSLSAPSREMLYASLISRALPRAYALASIRRSILPSYSWIRCIAARLPVPAMLIYWHCDFDTFRRSTIDALAAIATLPRALADVDDCCRLSHGLYFIDADGFVTVISVDAHEARFVSL